MGTGGAQFICTRGFTTGFLRAVVREARLRTSIPFKLILAVTVAAGASVFAFAFWQSYRMRVELRHLREAVQAAEQEQRGFHERIDEERRRFDEELKTRERQAEEFRRREQELKDLVAFYKSPLGQKLITSEPKAIGLSMAFMNSWAQNFSETVMGAFRAEMRKRGKQI